MTARKRLLSRLQIDPSGCLLWIGAKNSGYGCMKVGGTNRLVHRLMYEMFAEPIPEGMELDHLCRVRHCGNVAHLEPVSHRENTLRGVGPTAVNAEADRCWRGHIFSEANTYYRKTNERECRACRIIRNRAYRKRQRAALVEEGKTP